MKGVLPFALVGLLCGLVLLVVTAAKFQSPGDVLGVSASKSEITSGVNLTTNNKKSITGTVLWDTNLPTEIKVVSDKFVLGEAITIQVGSQSLSAVINKQSDALTNNTILIVNTQMFKNLGGDPEKSSSIQATVSN
jgi:hypothetical protein